MTNFKYTKIIFILVASLTFVQAGFTNTTEEEDENKLFDNFHYKTRKKKIDESIESLFGHCDANTFEVDGLSYELSETASDGWCDDFYKDNKMDRYCSCVNKLLAPGNLPEKEQRILDLIENRSYSLLTDLRRKRMQFYEISALTGIHQLYAEGLDGKSFKKETCFSNFVSRRLLVD